MTKLPRQVVTLCDPWGEDLVGIWVRPDTARLFDLVAERQDIEWIEERETFDLVYVGVHYDQ